MSEHVQTCLNLFRFNMMQIATIHVILKHVWTFWNMSKLVQIQYDMNCYDSWSLGTLLREITADTRKLFVRTSVYTVRSKINCTFDASKISCFYVTWAKSMFAGQIALTLFLPFKVKKKWFIEYHRGTWCIITLTL